MEQNEAMSYLFQNYAPYEGMDHPSKPVHISYSILTVYHIFATKSWERPSISSSGKWKPVVASLFGEVWILISVTWASENSILLFHLGFLF